MTADDTRMTSAGNLRTVHYDDPGRGPDGAVPDLAVRSVVGVFDSFADADAAAAALHQNGVPAEDISIVRGQPGDAPQTSAGRTRADRGIATGAAVGAVIGGALGLTALALTGIGPILAAGPLLAALSGAATGGALGALVGSLAGLGVPTERAQQYEAAIRAGGILLAVKVPDVTTARSTEDLFIRHGARDVDSYSPAL